MEDGTENHWVLSSEKLAALKSLQMEDGSKNPFVSASERLAELESLKNRMISFIKENQWKPPVKSIFLIKLNNYSFWKAYNEKNIGNFFNERQKQRGVGNSKNNYDVEFEKFITRGNLLFVTVSKLEHEEWFKELQALKIKLEHEEWFKELQALKIKPDVCFDEWQEIGEFVILQFDKKSQAVEKVCGLMKNFLTLLYYDRNERFNEIQKIKACVKDIANINKKISFANLIYLIHANDLNDQKNTANDQKNTANDRKITWCSLI